MADNSYGYPSAPTGLGLLNALNKGIQGYLQGRQLVYQRFMAQLAAKRQQDLADSLMTRRTDQTSQGEQNAQIRQDANSARYDPNSPYNQMRGNTAATSLDQKEDQQDRAAALDVLGNAARMASQGIDATGYVQQAVGALRPRARGYVLGQIPMDGTPSITPPPGAGPSMGAVPTMGADQGQGALPAPPPSGGVGGTTVPIPAPDATAGRIAPPPGSATAPASAPVSVPAPLTTAEPGSGLPFWMQPNRAAAQKQIQPLVAEYRSWINSPDTAKLPAALQDRIAQGYRSQFTSLGIDPDQWGIVSPVGGGKSSLIAPPPPEDPAKKQQYDARMTQLKQLSDRLSDPAYANDPNRPQWQARYNQLTAALTPGAPPLTLTAPGLTPEQKAQNEMERQRITQQAAAQASEQDYRNRSLKLQQDMHNWTMSGGADNPANWSTGEILQKRAELHKTGAPTMQLGPDGNIHMVAGPALVDSPQGKAIDSYLNSLAYAKAHGMPLPKLPGMVSGAAGGSGAGANGGRITPPSSLPGSVTTGLTDFMGTGAPSTPAPAPSPSPSPTTSRIKPPPARPKPSASPSSSPSSQPPQTKKRTVGGVTYSYTIR